MGKSKDEVLATLIDMGFNSGLAERAVSETKTLDEAMEQAMVLSALADESEKAAKTRECAANSGSHHPDVSALRRMFQTNLIVADSPVKLYSTTTKSNAFMLEQERRAMHLIQTKGIQFELIFLDLRKGDQAIVEAVSDSTELPQLHINGKYFGDIKKLQVGISTTHAHACGGIFM
eukprot:c8437_g1_i2.p1 GENE.c8437_g1_i2~~c8437_g1_i2.p1  ORF type:complete len:191 (-),score=49.81 c8437_g1_i2:478-1005(-)